MGSLRDPILRCAKRNQQCAALISSLILCKLLYSAFSIEIRGLFPAGKAVTTVSDSQVDQLNATELAKLHTDSRRFFHSAVEEELPIIAYSFVGYHGDMFGIPIALAAVFHPRNVYGVLLDASVPMTQISALHKHIVDLARTPSCDAACVEPRIFVNRLEFSVTHGGISEPL